MLRTLGYQLHRWISIIVLASATGCASDLSRGCDTAPPHVSAAKLVAQTAIQLDGRLNEAAWQSAEFHDFRGIRPADCSEGARVAVLYDDTNLYFGVELADRDIHQESFEDHARLFLSGDTAEIFLGPAGSLAYWEFHVSPLGHQAGYFYPSGGYKGLPSTMRTDIHTSAAISVRGTSNDASDEDIGWTAEIRVPFAVFATHGLTFDPGQTWLVLFARYNYGRQLETVEMSTFPSLSIPDFHHREEYGELTFKHETE